MDIFKKLEKIRREIIVFSILAVLLVMLAVASMVFLGGFWRNLLIASAGILFLLTLLMISLSTSSYKQLFSRNMMKSVMTSVFEDVTYEPERALPPSMIENTDMIMTGNRYASGEYRTGVYRGIRFTMADVSLKNVIQNGKRTASITFFDGSWLIFEFSKSFTDYLQVKEKSFLNAQKPRGNHPDMNRVTVGSEDFVRFFKVYAESEEKATAFLSPSLQEAILALNYDLCGDLMFYFSGRYLHIALHGKQAQYEPPMLGKLYREEVERILLADCRAVSSFLDRLLADESLYTPES